MNHISFIETLRRKLKSLSSENVLKIEKAFCALGLGVILVVLTASAYQVRFLRTTYNMKQFLPPRDHLLEQEDSVKKIFNLQQTPGFMATVTLPQNPYLDWFSEKLIKILTQVTNEIKSLKNVNHVISLTSIEGIIEDKKSKSLNTGPLLSLTPKHLRKEKILSNPLLSPGLISKDSRTTMIIIDTGYANAAQQEVAQAKIKSILHKNFPQYQTHLGGTLAIQTDVGHLLKAELKNFLIAAFILSVFTLLGIFSNMTGVLLPLMCIGASNIFVLGGMAFFDIPFTVLSTTIPILVNITVLAITTHTLLRIDEESRANKKFRSKFSLVAYILKKLLLPNLLAALTTCIGFLTLLTVKVPLVKQYGLSTSACVVGAWGLTTLLMVCLLPFLPLPKARAWTKMKARWALYIFKYKWPISISVSTVSILMAFGGNYLNWSPRLLDDLPRQHPSRVATENIDKNLGGVIPQEIVIESKTQNTWSQPQNLKTLEKILAKARQIKGVGSAIGLPDYLKMAILDGKIASKKTISEALFLFSLSAQNPLDQFLTSNGRITRISLRLNDLPAHQMRDVIKKVTAYVQEGFPKFKVITIGMANNAHRLNSNLSHELIFGFWQALIAIFVLLIFIFRSLKWSLIACLPNLVSPALLLGALALLDTPVKPGIALVFSIALGLSFNNTVYLLERVRSQGTRNLGFHAIRKAFYFESNACVISTMVVFVGFIVFLGSYFSLNRYFGAFMLLSIFGGLLGDLILLPALLAIFPKALAKTEKLKPLKKAEPIAAAAASIVISLITAYIFTASPEAIAAVAENPSQKAKRILDLASKQISSRDESAAVTLIIIEANGEKKERKLSIKRKSGKENHVLVRLQDPPDLRGTAFLAKLSKDSEEQWLYLPSSKTTRKIVGSGKSAGFLGSEITYDDLSANSTKGAKTVYVKDMVLDGTPVSVIDILGQKKFSAYSKVRSYISQDKNLVLKGEYFDWNGKMLKILTFKNYKLYDGKVWRALDTKIRNVQNKRGTELRISNLKVNQKLPDSEFSTSALESD